MEHLSPGEEHAVYELFKWSVILKGLISLAEVILGVALLIIPPHFFIPLVQSTGVFIASHFDAAFILKAANELVSFDHGDVFFISLYVLSRGLIKCFLIYALLQNIRWAYPASLVVLGLFVLYQMYEIATVGSLFVIGITIFDLIVMYSIIREWKIVRERDSKSGV